MAAQDTVLFQDNHPRTEFHAFAEAGQRAGGTAPGLRNLHRVTDRDRRQAPEPLRQRGRNPLIAGTFYRRGIIEERGRGTLKMAAETTAAGMPPPEIEESGGCVTVRFRHGRPPVRLTAHFRGSGLGSSRLHVDNLTESQQAILALLNQGNQALALREICARLAPETTERRVRKDLGTLKARGLITSTGHGRGARWKQI